MSRIPSRLLAAALLSATLALASGAAEANETGVWLTESGKAHVRIEQCGEKICGAIVWMRKPLDDAGQEKLDKFNPDESLRWRKVLGLRILSGFTSDGNGGWEGGRIYDPVDGETYKSIFVLESPDVLKLRGYIGIPLFGKSQIWTRVE